VLGALGVLLAVGAVAAFFLLHGHGVGSSGLTGGSGGGAAVALTGATAYDPYGTGGEHNADAPKATDGSASTFWHTEHYRSSFASIGKPGVGLVLDAHQAVKLHQLGLSTGTPGFTAEIQGGDSPSSFGNVVATLQVSTGRTIYTIGSSTPYRYYLIWITNLGPNSEVQINEVSATKS
jgi:hypothetical protein